LSNHLFFEQSLSTSLEEIPTLIIMKKKNEIIEIGNQTEKESILKKNMMKMGTRIMRNKMKIIIDLSSSDIVR